MVAGQRLKSRAARMVAGSAAGLWRRPAGSRGGDGSCGSRVLGRCGSVGRGRGGVAEAAGSNPGSVTE